MYVKKPAPVKVFPSQILFLLIYLLKRW